MGNPASDDDDATIRTLPQIVAGPTPTPTPVVLPPTGGQGPLGGDGTGVIVFVVIGVALIGMGWILWTRPRPRAD